MASRGAKAEGQKQKSTSGNTTQSSGDFRVKCVRVYGAPETKKLLEDAYKCLQEENLSPVWFSEDDCFSVQEKERNSVYIFDVFEGEAFEHIASLKCRILGPMCILTSLACKKNIPKTSHPIYNLALKDVTVCCTNLDNQAREELHLKVERMGGQTCRNFTDEVTHLVAGTVGSQKYLVAASCGKHIMTPKWVDVVWDKSKLNAVHGLDEQFQEHKCPIFLGRVITVSGLGSKERTEAKKLIEKEGGTYSGEMKVKECTHLIINEPKGQKFLFAQKWQIYIVKSEWLYDSIEKGYCQDETEYTVEAAQGGSKPQMKTSTPERRSTVGGMSDISNISMISMVNVNETVATNITNMTTNMTNMTNITAAGNNTTHMLEPDPTDGLKLDREPADLFLDATKIYLSGFRGAPLEKLRKIINAGGGTRFNKISENLTHIVLGERLPSDIEQIRSLHTSPAVVTSQWLVDCYKQETVVDEAAYSIRDLAPSHPTTPETKRSSRKSVAKPEVAKPSTSRQPDVNRHGADMSRGGDVSHHGGDGIPQGGEDEEEDIMSQYMAQPLHQTDATKSSNDTTVAPAAEDEATQEPSEITVEVPPGQGIFGRKTFVFYGFVEEHVTELVLFVTENGGQVLKMNARRIPDYAVVPFDGFPVDRTVKDIVTNTWLEMCIEQEDLLDVQSNPLFTPLEIQLDKFPLKDCVLSISGYVGTERDRLLQIAERLGARTQDCFVRSAKKGLLASSHLILKAPEGSKYKAAKMWNTPALNKRWVFDCAKSGKREPEKNYDIDNAAAENDSTVEPSSNKVEDRSENKTTTTTCVQQNCAQNQDKSLSKQCDKQQSSDDPDETKLSKEDCNTSASSDRTRSDHEQEDRGAKSDQSGSNTNSDQDTSAVDHRGSADARDAKRTSGLGVSVGNNGDFSATGDTEALLAQLDTQGEVVDKADVTKTPVRKHKEETNPAATSAADVDDDVVVVASEPVVTATEADRGEASGGGKKTRVEAPSKSVIQSLRREGQQSDTPPLLRFIKKIEQKRKDEPGSPDTNVMSIRDKLLKKTPLRRNWREEEKSEVAGDNVGQSQKENLVAVATPVQSRIQELKKQEGGGSSGKPDGGKSDWDTPSKFMNPKVRYHPMFDTEELLKEFETPEAVRAAKAKRRESLPLDELYDKMLDQACRTVLLAKEKQLESKESTVLQGVVIIVGKKLAKDQSDLNDIVVSLGGDYRWNNDSSCTHFIFQGRQNDTAKDFKMAKSQGLLIVSPHWLYMCKEQNARVDESLFPHTFNPNLQLSLSTKRTPMRTPRSTRRNARDRLNSKPDEPSQTPVSRLAAPPAATDRGDNYTQSSKGGNSKGSSKLTSPVRTSPRRSPHRDDHQKMSDVVEQENGGSLEMREVLSRQLENVMAEAKGKKRRRSKRLNCSGQVGTPEEVANSGGKRRTQERENQQRSSTSLPARNLSGEKPDEKTAAEMAPSQSIQVVWDDPMGRMEQEKLAHQLERVESPTQDVGGMYQEPEDAQYSETDEEEEAPAPPVFTDQPQGDNKTTPKATKPSDKTPTPEAPSIAFPTASKVQEVTPPKPVVIDDEEEQQTRPRAPPVFMLSGMNQAEKDDYGALIEQLGGTMMDTQEFDRRCSHLVLNSISRNEKFLASLAAGNWVLHKSYLEACREHKCFIEEDFYEWGSEGTLSLVKNLDSHVRMLAAAARDWRIKISEEKQSSSGKVGAFCSWKVLLLCGASKERNYKRLLEAGGATVMIDRPPFSNAVNITHVILEPQKANLTKADLEAVQSWDCCCLKPEFIPSYLADPAAVTVEQFCPEEIKELRKSQVTESSAKNLKRKASGTDLSLKRSKRR